MWRNVLCRRLAHAAKRLLSDKSCKSRPVRQQTLSGPSLLLFIGIVLYADSNSAAVECHGAAPCKSRREQLQEYLKEAVANESSRDIEMLPEYTSNQVAERNGGDGGPIWMSYGGFVYDVTDFIPLHPGGTERILRAAGAAIEPFWYLHQQHFDTEEPMQIMRGLVIGRLAQADQDAIDYQLESLQQQLDGFRLELKIDDSVTKLSLNDLKLLPKTDRISQVGCPQSRRPVSTLLFGGVLMKELVKSSPVQRLVFHAMDGETVTVEMDDYDDIMVAYEENGAPLTQGRGFPLRIIIPGKRVVKWVKGIEVQ